MIFELLFSSRYQYRCIHQKEVTDDRLKVMCIALWKKMKYAIATEKNHRQNWLLTFLKSFFLVLLNEEKKIFRQNSFVFFFKADGSIIEPVEVKSIRSIVSRLSWILRRQSLEIDSNLLTRFQRLRSHRVCRTIQQFVDVSVRRGFSNVDRPMSETNDERENHWFVSVKILLNREKIKSLSEKTFFFQKKRFLRLFNDHRCSII